MEHKYMDVLKELNYADLSKEQELKLRELEKEFNNEFGKDFYFMVMERK
jgi:hypothetical protein